MDSSVSFDIEAGVARLTLARPETGNAVSPDLVKDFSAAVQGISASKARAVLLRAEGSNFCVGGDLRYLGQAGRALPEKLREMAEGVHAALLLLYEMDAPIVCAAKGNIVGGGLGIALVSDFLLVAEDARFSTGYTRLGLSADAGTSYFLTRALGSRRARALLIDSRFFSAREAVDYGLADRVVKDDGLDGAAQDLAAQLAAGPTSAYGTIRRLTDAAITNDLKTQLAFETDQICALAERDEVANGIKAVLAKQKPTFSL